MIPERREPTHILKITVPLHISKSTAVEEPDIQGALAESLRVILSVVRVGTLGLICDQITVTMEDLPAVP